MNIIGLVVEHQPMAFALRQAYRRTLRVVALAVNRPLIEAFGSQTGLFDHQRDDRIGSRRGPAVRKKSVIPGSLWRCDPAASAPPARVFDDDSHPPGAMAVVRRAQDPD